MKKDQFFEYCVNAYRPAESLLKMVPAPIELEHNPLYHALRDWGKDARIINCDAPPENLTFMNGDGCVEVYDPAEHDAFIASADLLVALDFNDIRRVRQLEATFRAASGKKIVIDHHREPSPFADFYCSIPDASSTAEIVYDVIGGDDAALSQPIALGLYVGIMTDSSTLLHANGHHMMVVAEPLRQAVDRIAGQHGQITSLKRL